MIQAGVLNVREEEATLDKVFTTADSIAQSEKDGVRVDLTSGYFGLYNKYKQALLESSAPCHVVAASPQANGFYKSAGVSKLIPDGYTLLEARFHRDLVRHGRDWDEEKKTGVELAEWMKDGWTYHAKGGGGILNRDAVASSLASNLQVYGCRLPRTR
jgi:CDP-diacylglycerol--glycerol-3-phosphate 3-phosphatidyltransferase